MNAIDLRGVVVDGSRVLERAGIDRMGTRPRLAWRCQCACGNEFFATSPHIRKVQRGAKDRHRLRCAACKTDLTPVLHRWTAEEWITIVNAIVAWAIIVRRRYLNFECDICGASYHPRHGRKPPRERRDACGHAHFRDAFDQWDAKWNDWYSEDW